MYMSFFATMPYTDTNCILFYSFFVPKMPSYLILVRLGRNVQSSNFIFKFIFRLCNLSGKFHDKCEENKPNSELNGDRLERSIYGHS